MTRIDKNFKAKAVLMAASPDKERCAIAFEDGMIRVFDPALEIVLSKKTELPTSEEMTAIAITKGQFAIATKRRIVQSYREKLGAYSNDVYTMWTDVPVDSLSACDSEIVAVAENRAFTVSGADYKNALSWARVRGVKATLFGDKVGWHIYQPTFTDEQGGKNPIICFMNGALRYDLSRAFHMRTRLYAVSEDDLFVVCAQNRLWRLSIKFGLAECADLSARAPVSALAANAGAVLAILEDGSELKFTPSSPDADQPVVWQEEALTKGADGIPLIAPLAGGFIRVYNLTGKKVKLELI